MKKPTIYDIKRATAESSPYFFSRKSMKFFGQTLKNFKVTRTENPSVFHLVAILRAEGRKVGNTERYFCNDKLFHNYASALEYIKEKN